MSAHLPNRLAQETSPYLLQHAYNPVDWHPWGEEAFTRAKAEDRPILLSVGYSACHWCHVMERESFENDAIAEQMNRDFINIKVDREERPDIDAIYMNAVQLMTGQGGWPMTLFLTPEGKPFFGGTYFPPNDMHGRPGFPRVLEAVASAWRLQRNEIEQQSAEILGHLQEGDALTRNLPDTLLTPQILENAYNTLSAQFDRAYGGFGSAPKFPQPANLDFLLRFHLRSKRQEPLAMVEKTLQRMALGGIYDQLGGGFHRYSTDAVWLVPHFEKMLYDNAQLAQIYCRAYQATGKSFYQGVAEETLEYVMREMTDPETGGFYSAQDADSDGEEGKFFVWTPAETAAVLGERKAAVFNAFYDVSPGGNWEGKTILRVVMDAPEVARKFGLSLEEAAQMLDTARLELFQARKTRPRPGLDDKVLTSWNGLMLAAFAECAAVFGREDFRETALRNARFLEQKMCHEAEGMLRLLRTSRGGAGKLNGYLEDYAFFADGLLHLYQATFDPHWLQMATRLTESMITYFWDDAEEGFFATSRDHATLIHRLKDWDDNATPGGNSVAIEVLLKLSAYTGNADYLHRAARVLRKIGTLVEKHPYSFARMLGSLDLYLEGPLEIGLRGEAADSTIEAMLAVVFAPYLPNKVVAFSPIDAVAHDEIHFLRDRPALEGRPTAYVCRNFTCNLPATTSEALQEQLAAPASPGGS